MEVDETDQKETAEKIGGDLGVGRIVLLADNSGCGRRQIVVQTAFKHVDQPGGVRLDATRLPAKSTTVNFF